MPTSAHGRAPEAVSRQPDPAAALALANEDQLLMFNWSCLYDTSQVQVAPWVYPSYPTLTGGAPGGSWSGARAELAPSPKPILGATLDGLNYWCWTMHSWMTQDVHQRKTCYFYELLPKLEDLVSFYVMARINGSDKDLEPEPWFWVSRNLRKSPAYMEIIKHFVHVFSTVLANGKVCEYNKYMKSKEDIQAGLAWVSKHDLGVDVNLEPDIKRSMREALDKVEEMTKAHFKATTGSSTHPPAGAPLIVKQEPREHNAELKTVLALTDPGKGKGHETRDSNVDMLWGEVDANNPRQHPYHPDPVHLAAELHKLSHQGLRKYKHPPPNMVPANLPGTMQIYLQEYNKTILEQVACHAKHELKLIRAYDSPVHWDDLVTNLVGGDWSDSLLQLMYKICCI
ncbi:hypothetical protein DACRYDRAFT_13579 [Dacryopinax primogenitus]|uniref:Uncharacterized protein n=1 Tax=Dacryopinax primogenitus (strain DJM 731) TaxID=1858805 RepID=M5G9Y2_DACPD|nr:uncharacterized protein DACRYDRAFT_13579 [Dacryopinax primogenitus]EJU05629.1 hypothetical protein DACRYDRAFT_13579 [Dacryopinax primogenitus]